MRPGKRFLFGGIGALMPVILTIISIDLFVAFNKPEAFSILNVVGHCLRYSVLFFVGGFVAYLHTDEDKPFKLFELGIAAPALITSLVAANGISGSMQSGKQAFSFNPAAIVFLQSGSAYAAEATEKKAVQRSEPDAWSQILDGITGRSYRRSDDIQASAPVASGDWVAAQGGNIPAGAVKGGAEQAPGSESLYVCRVKLNNGVHPGKVRPAFKGCYVPFGGKEHKIFTYEVLTGNYKWVSANKGIIPTGALEAGSEAGLGGEVLYVCRADHRGSTHPGKIRTAFGGCNIPWGGREITIRSYDVLVKSN